MKAAENAADPGRDAADPLAQWLSYRDTMPMAWRVAGAGDPPTAWIDQNLRALAAVTTLEERGRIDPERSDAQEFERLHHKFDVMIELLGALLRATQSVPPAQSLRLSREGMAWPRGDDAPPPGAIVDVEVYLHPSAPAPLRWRGTVVAHHHADVCLRFIAMPELMEAALERHVFTRHRRSVADARSPGGRG